MLETLTSNYHLSKTIGSEKDLITPHIFAPPQLWGAKKAPTAQHLPASCFKTGKKNSSS